MKYCKRLRPLAPAERLRLKRLSVVRSWAAEERKRVRNFRVIYPK
jgi:hypothetical protein